MPLLLDLCFLFYPGYVFYRRALAAGALPLWNPYNGCGEPFLADIERAVFYPPSLLYLLPSTSLAVVLSAALHLLVAAIGTYILMRQLLVSRRGCLLAGVMYPFSAYTVTKMAFPSELNTAAWFPAVLAAFVLFCKRPTRRSLILLACLIATQFLAGFPEVVAFSMAALALYAIVRALYQPSLRSASRIALLGLLGLGAAGLLAIALAAAQFLPTWELLARSPRGQVVDPGLDMESFHPMALFTLLIPSLHGSCGAYGALWGRYWSPTCLMYSIAAVYVGIVPLVVLLTAALHRLLLPAPLRPTCPDAPPEQRCRAPFFITLLLLTLLYAMGKHTPFFPLLWHTIPPLQHFVSPPKILFATTLALACLSAIGLDALTATSSRSFASVTPLRRALARWGPLALFAGITVFIVVCLAGNGAVGIALLHRWFNLGAVPPSLACQIPWNTLVLDSVKLCLVGLIAAAVLHLYVHRTEASRPLAWTLALIAFADLAVTNVPVMQAGPKELIETLSTGLDRLSPPGNMTRFLGYQHAVDDALREGVLAFLPEPTNVVDLPGTQAQADSWQQAWQRLVGILRRRLYISMPMVDEAFAVRPSNVLYPALAFGTITVADDPGVSLAARLRLFAMLNCDRILIPNDVRCLFRYEPLRPTRLNILERALPRAYVVGAVTVVDDLPEALRRIAGGAFRPLAGALIDRHTAETVPLDLPRSDRVAHAVQDIRYQHNHVALRVTSASRGLLVLTDTYYPGWIATVNGEPAPLLRVNVCQRAVPVPAGSSTVEMTFRPASLRTGSLISLITLVGLTLVALLPRRRTDARRDSPARPQLDASTTDS